MQKGTPMKISHIDHIVLTARDVTATVEFYESVLGMEKEIFGKNKTALRFGSQKINLHQYNKEVEPKAYAPTPGSLDICFITEMNIEEAMTHLKSKGVEIIEGPVTRIGAIGPIVSFYFRDPDGNLIEVSHYEEDTQQHPAEG